jgi:hypothetical protein
MLPPRPSIGAWTEQKEPRPLDGGLVRTDGRRGRGGVGLDAVVLLLRDIVLLHEVCVALDVGLRILHLGPLAGERRLRLRERGLVGTGIDGEEQLAPLQVLPIAKMDLHDLARHLRAHGDRDVGLDGPDVADLERHGLLHHGAHAHRHGLDRRRFARLRAAERTSGQRQHRNDESLPRTRHGLSWFRVVALMISAAFGTRAPVACASWAIARNQRDRAWTSSARASARADCAVKRSMMDPTPAL